MSTRILAHERHELVSIESFNDLFGNARFKCVLCHVHGVTRTGTKEGREMLEQDIRDHESGWLHISLVKQRKAS